MKIALPTLIAAVAVAGVAFTTPADTMEGHTSVSPQNIKWGPAPAMLPPGAEAAVLFGDPSKEGLFVLRLRFPKGYRVPPHTHPVDEVLTVISGTFNMGMGENADQSKAQPSPAGSFHALPPGTAHYVFKRTREEFEALLAEAKLQVTAVTGLESGRFMIEATSGTSANA
jgi:quercetin dioxygenase-like cupin family protein